MIKVLVADDQALVRGGLVAMLNLEPDLTVVAEVSTGDEVLPVPPIIKARASTHWTARTVRRS